MTHDEIKVMVNRLKDQMRQVELELDTQGYRGLAAAIYDARLRISHSLSATVGWPDYSAEMKGTDR